MLQLHDGTIVETTETVEHNQGLGGLGANQSLSGFQNLNNCNYGNLGGYGYQTVWNAYPVYVTSDKTAKAIEILKKLQTEKVIEVKSVPRFIELVEQISAIL